MSALAGRWRHLSPRQHVYAVATGLLLVLCVAAAISYMADGDGISAVALQTRT